MARWLLGLSFVTLVFVGCGNASPAAEPRSTTASAPTSVPTAAPPFSVRYELTEIDPYPGGGMKNIGPAFIMHAPIRRPGASEMTRQFIAITKVPAERFQTEAVPVIAKELTLPADTAIVWRFNTESIAAVVVGAQALASFDDIATAEPYESHYESTTVVNGKMSHREGERLMVRVTFAPAAKARIEKDARGRPLVIAYGGWAADDGIPRVDSTYDFRFSWLDDVAAEKAAREFIAAVSRRRSGR